MVLLMFPTMQALHLILEHPIDQVRGLVPVVSDKDLAVSISSMTLTRALVSSISSMLTLIYYIVEDTMSHWQPIPSQAISKSSIAEIYLSLRTFELLIPLDPRSKTHTIHLNRYDNTWALRQIEEGHNSVMMRKPFTDADKKGLSKAGKTLPRVITLGGDHTITLPLLRSINRAYGPVTVIHFDSHL